MKSMMMAAVAVAAVLGGTMARAAEFTPAPNGTQTIDLDTRNGAFSFWEVGDLSGITSLRAEIQVKLLGSDPRWAPGFYLEVSGEKDAARVQIVSRDRKTLTLAIVHFTGEGTWEAKDAVIEVDQVVSVAFDWTSTGIVSVTAQPKDGPVIRREIRLASAPKRVRANASTGELMLAPVRLGTTKP